MEYIYAAMLLHKAGHKVDEASVKKVLEAAGVKVDEARAKALVAALEGVNIDEAVEKAAMPVAVAAAPAQKYKRQERHQLEHAKRVAAAHAAELGRLGHGVGLLYYLA